MSTSVVAARPGVDTAIQVVGENASGNLEVFAPLAGTSTTPMTVAVAASQSITGSPTLDAAHYTCPMLVWTGSLLGNVTVTFPNIVGAVWDISLAGVTFSAHTITCECGGNTVTAVIPATATTGARVGVYADGCMALFGQR